MRCDSPLSNYVPIEELRSCTQPLDYQPNTTGNLNALQVGVARILQNPVSKFIMTVVSHSLYNDNFYQ